MSDRSSWFNTSDYPEDSSYPLGHDEENCTCDDCGDLREAERAQVMFAKINQALQDPEVK